MKFCEIFLGITFMDFQKYCFMESWDKQFALWCLSRNGGKALALDTIIPTPDGERTIEELNVGDIVFGRDGESVKIMATSPIFLNHDCYEVEFEDGEKIVADKDHLWEIKLKDKKGVFNTEELYAKGVYRNRKDGKGKEYCFRVPMSEPLKLNKKDLKIDPYVLGVWLGDGHSRDTRITSHKDDYLELKEHIEACNYTVKINDKNETCYNLNIDYVGKGKSNLFKEGLEYYNLLENKHIPNDYLYGSIEQRLSLLQGLMDTDGTCRSEKNRTNACVFYQKDANFIKQFEKLLSSLGIKYKTSLKRTKCNGKVFESYEVYFYTDINMPPFKLKRKYDLLPLNLNKRMNYKSIISIKKVDSVPTKCIMVDSEEHLYLCGEKNTVTHNSTLTAPFNMAKMMLFPNFNSFILSLTAQQSQDTYLKMEAIAKKQIESFAGLNDIFLGEVVSSSAHDGFIHHPQGFRLKLYNGSSTTTCAGNEDNIRGKRSALNIYDESGFLSENYISTTKAFATQDSSFKLGGGLDQGTIPDNIPNQLLFCSSASDTDSYFYRMYAEWSKRMFLGDPDYFVASLDCEVIIGATYNGIILEKPLLSQSKVDDEMRANPSKCLREYYNKFDNDGGSLSIIKRSTIAHNSTVRKPLLFNEGNTKRKIAFAFDPSRSYDNSCLGVAEYVYDDKIGWKMAIQNMVNFNLLCEKKNRNMMRTPDQVDEIKDMLVKYNGKGFPDYENIDIFMIDSGAGGAGVNIADYFMEDWTDRYGSRHRGLIDKIDSAEHISRFPNAIDKLKLISPKKYRTEMMDDFVELLNLGLINFTEEYDLKGYLNIPKENEKEKITEIDEVTGEKTTINGISYISESLSWEEELALKNIDIAKEEAMAMQRIDNKERTNHTYSLSPEKANKMHDDRFYVLSMLAWHLKNLRRENITKRNAPKQDWSTMPTFVTGLNNYY